MRTNAPESDRLLSVAQAAAELGVHPVTVHRYVREGKVRAFQPRGPGHAIRIDRRELLHSERRGEEER